MVGLHVAVLGAPVVVEDLVVGTLLLVVDGEGLMQANGTKRQIIPKISQETVCFEKAL